MKPRVGHAVNLGPGRRRFGIPEGCDELRRETRNKTPRTPMPFDFSNITMRSRLPELPRRPFVSRFEDGHRDVRWLYPQAFNTHVTKLSYEPESLRPVRDPEEFAVVPLELI